MIDTCPTCGDLYEEEGPLVCCGALVLNCFHDPDVHDWYADTGEPFLNGSCRCGAVWEAS